MSARRIELSVQLDIDHDLWPLFSGSLPGAAGPALVADVADWLVEALGISRGVSCGAVEVVAVRDSTLLSVKAAQLGVEPPAAGRLL